MLVIALKDDHVSAWEAVYRGARDIGADFILGGSGHNAGVINPPAANKHGFWTNADKPAERPASGSTAATRHEGSWWPLWTGWLERQGRRQAGAGPQDRRRHRARARPLCDDAVMDAMTSTEDVLTYKEGLAGRLRLNRPKALHSLNRQMVRDMAAALIEWRDDPDVRIILIDHAEGRGFCAGGDVVDIAQNVEGA